MSLSSFSNAQQLTLLFHSSSIFIEGETQTLDLEADPATFGLLLNWMYTQDIKFNQNIHPMQATLVHLWILADYLQIPKLQNQAIDLYHVLSITQDNMGPTAATGWSARHVYESTTETSPLRRLLILHFAVFAQKKGLEEQRIKKMFPRQLFRDIAAELAGFNEDNEDGYSLQEKWLYLDTEEYHVDEKPRLLNEKPRR